MKKSFFVWLALALLMISCDPHAPRVSIKALDGTEGVPGDTLEFSASGSVVKGDIDYQWCNFEVFLDGKVIGSQIKERSVDGDAYTVFSYEFTKAGEHTVKATITDSAGQSGYDAIPVFIESPFASIKSFSLAMSVYYQNEDYKLEPQESEFKKLRDAGILKRSKWEIVNEDGEVFISNDCICDIDEENLTKPGEYFVTLTVFDKYDNSHQFFTSFRVVSPDNPRATIAPINDAIEYQKVKLDGSASKPDNHANSTGVIESYHWSLYERGKETVVVDAKKDSGKVFDFDLSNVPAGEYDIQLVVANQSKLTDTSVRVPLTVLENIPEIVGYNKDELNAIDKFETKEVLITINPNLDKVKLNKSRIRKIVMSYDREATPCLDVFPPDGRDFFEVNEPLVIAWIPEYLDEGDFTYTGEFYLENESNKLSEGYPYSIEIKSNKPKIDLKTDKNAFYGETITIDASESKLPSGEVLNSITLTLANITDNGDAPVPAEFVDFDGSEYPIIYELPEKGVKEVRKYQITYTLVSDFTTVTGIETITVTEPKVVAEFLIKKDDQIVQEIFTTDLIMLDAAPSRAPEGEAVVEWFWQIKLEGQALGLGDAVMEDDDTATPTVYFTKAGNYELSLNVKASNGMESDVAYKDFIKVKSSVPKNVAIVVEGPDPLGYFDFSASAESPLTADGSDLTYQWYIGEYPLSSSVKAEAEGLTFRTNEFVFGDNFVFVIVTNEKGETAVKQVKIVK